MAVWWPLGDFQQVALLAQGRLLPLTSLNPALAALILYLGLPLGALAIAHLIATATRREFLATNWRATDLVRLTFWGTVSSTLVFLLVAVGFDAVYRRSWVSVPWLIATALLRLVGMLYLQRAEGIRFRPVSSGEIYKRAFSLARSMNVNLNWVHGVPIGRGHLTNAHGWPGSIAVTENYGKFPHGPGLDFIIGHELSHGKELHGIKNLAVAPGILCVLALVCCLLPTTRAGLRPILYLVVTLLSILIACFISRRFEYAADDASVASQRIQKR